MTNTHNDLLWILYGSTHDKPNSSAFKMLNEARNQGLNAEVFFHQYFSIKRDRLYYNETLMEALPRLCFVRGHPFPLIRYLETKGVRVVNNFYSTKTCKDKWAAYKVVRELGVEQPFTKLFRMKSYAYYCEIFKESQFLIKSRYGSQGKDIYLITNECEYQDVVKGISKQSDYIIQQYISYSYGKDVRCYIIDDQIVGYVLRKNENDFKSNVALGGLSYPFDSNAELDKDSLRIAKALEGEVISIDYIFKSENEMMFCEANTNAAFASYSFLGYDMRFVMIQYMKKIMQN